MQFRLRTLVAATAIGPPIIAWFWASPQIAFIVGFLSPLFALLIIPIWAGVKRGEIQRERRLRRERRRLASNT